MRFSLPAVVLCALVLGLPGSVRTAAAQQARTGSVLDESMVPRGRARAQLGIVFSSWNRRFGRAMDGSESLEPLGEDLTDASALSLFSGTPTLRSSIRDLTGLSTWDPVLGSTAARVKQDITTIDFGLHVGVFDWLTVGAVLPWVQPRTVVDLFFEPDTVSGNLGVSPRISDAAGVDAFLAGASAADAAAAQYASSVCAGGPSAACTDAQALSTRTTAFATGVSDAYSATPLFPLAGSAAGDALTQEAQQLGADLTAAGLGGLPALSLATDVLSAEGLALLPAVVGGGVESAPLRTRKGLYGRGDLELSARVRLLDNLTPAWSDERTFPRQRSEARAAGSGLRYRVTASFLTRLPTGQNEDPDILLDVGRADAQLDFEGGLTASLAFGRLFGLSAGGRYGIQGSTTLVKRVASPETPVPALSTRRQVTFDPGFYVVLGLVPELHVSEALTLHAEYRFFQKGRDRFQLVTADPSLDPTVLELESGIKQHQIGGGVRYDTIAPWLAGSEGFPAEVHLRLIHTFDGSGGQAPKVTRVEAGLRLFQRFWGPSR
jgi:hypothetical protein